MKRLVPRKNSICTDRRRLLTVKILGDLEWESPQWMFLCHEARLESIVALSGSPDEHTAPSVIARSARLCLTENQAASW